MDLQNKDTLFSNFFIQKNAFVHHESAWKGHIALSQWLVWKLRPQVFVELGVQHGTSYFSFCQRIAEEHLGTRCYAVDTWKGDENTGEYTEHIFTNVSEYNKAYSDFSTLIRSKFAEALPRFEDRSIDILHIDGAHAYEAVKEDFSLYLPKVSDKGIVLLHDSAERGEGFGVWRFVDELTSKYPCFSFKHSHGLTIIAIGSQAPGLLGDLLALDISDEEKAGICSAFEQLNHLCLFQAPPDQRVYPRLGLDFGGGFTRGGEFKYCSSSNNIRIHQNFSEILHLKQFYVQPLWGSCILQFTSCCVTLLNGKQVFLSPERSTGYSIGPYYFFETNTPQFYFAVNEAIKEITVSFFLVGDTEMLMAVKGNALQNTFRAYKADTETRLEDLEKTLIAAREKNAALMQSDHERDTELAQTQNELAAAYTEAHALRGERDAAHAELTQTQNDLAAAYAEAHALRGERDAAHAELAQTQNDLAAAYTETHTLRDERDAAYAELAQTQNDLAAAYTEAHALRGERDAAEKHVAALHHSLSWAVTAPLRLTYDILAWPSRTVASFNMRRTLFSLRYSRVGGALYNTCLSQAMKNRINQAWSGETLAPSYPAAIPQSVVTPNSQPTATVSESPNGHREPVFIPDPAWYEEKRPLPIPADYPVKIIAFYLPQFHPFPENDEWWGEGFTEWTNVTKAKPLFDGHYQPKLPGAMGFYDLRLPEVLRKQAALAKEFGIYGFCFHHYYFAGKRLMEKPVDTLLENRDIDLPFCLCWANENWTRRWDGQEKELLIAQNHTAEDDLNFLMDLQKYIDDPRYIRIDGKPLLIIYKPNQFPDMADTVHRWHAYYREQGKDIFLAMAQTFGETDPTKYGFDAAVEFPPHASANSILYQEKVQNLKEGFSGYIFDYSYIPKANPMPRQNYNLFKCVFPSWDNTARMNLRAHLYANSSPAIYEQWLGNALEYAHTNLSASQCFVFINAWNEWAEGAYLEPDRVYGYACLNATSRALSNLAQKTKASPLPLTLPALPDGSKLTTTKIALHVHLYYPDLLEEILNYLQNIPVSFDLFISIPENIHKAPLLKRIRNTVPSISILKIKHVPNFGTNVAPFLCIFGDILSTYDIIGHIHTKKTLRDPFIGTIWRKHLLDRILPGELLQTLLYHLDNNEADILYPETFPLVKDQLIWHINYERTAHLASKLGIYIPYTDGNIDFPSGCMFWCTKLVIQKLLTLKLTLDEFNEAHKEDGTLAHAIERLMGFIVPSSRIRHIALHHPAQTIYSKEGICPVCGKKTIFSTNSYDLRNNYSCACCGSLPLDRIIHKELNKILEVKKEIKTVLNINYNRHISKKFKHLTYLANNIHDIIPYLDGTLPSLNKKFDLILCNEILQSTLDPTICIKNLFKLCNDNGIIILTPLISHNLLTTTQRASKIDNKIIYYKERKYYYEKFVFWDFGLDFIKKIQKICKEYNILCNVNKNINEQYGIEGDYLHFFIMHKMIS